MKKQRILLLLLLAAAVGFFFIRSPILQFLGPADVTGPQYLMQVVTADAAHQRTISWQAKAAADAGSLELRTSGAPQSEIFAAAGELLPLPDGADRRLYTVRLTGLSPGTAYEYRVVAAGRQSGWHAFTTAAEPVESFKALIFGDSQCLNYAVWADTASTAWRAQPDAAFFINMGDLVDNGQDDDQWQDWLRGAPMIDRIPAAPVMGNHEAYSLDWKVARPELYLALFALPENGPAGLERFAYAYDYGEVHFVALNTQAYELGGWWPDLLAAQAKWLEDDLAKTTKKWKIVLMHRGVWKFPPDGSLDAIGESFVPIFDRYHVDIVFTGHVHAYARTGPVVGGSRVQPGGTVYITTGRSGSKVWERSPQKPWDEFFYNPLDQPNYLVLEADDDKLQVTAFNQDGSWLDQVDLAK